MGTKYKPDDHKRAFELYRELGSFYAVSKEKGMPSHCTLLRWARPSFNCSCGFHGWDALEERISKEVKARSKQVGEQDEQIKPDLEKYVLPDLKKLQIIRTIEKKAFDAIMAGIAVDPDTLSEGQRIIFAGWREGRVITGEPVEAIEHRMKFVELTVEEERVLEDIRRRMLLGEEG